MVSRSARNQLVKFWDKLINPQDLESAFICTILFLRLAGLFPYKQTAEGFEISYFAFTITLLHCTVFAFVNITLILEDPMQLAKPIIVDSDLGVGANLIIRSLGVLISVMVFMPIFTGMSYFASVLNRYILLMNLLDELGIQTKHLFKKMLHMSASATLAVFVISLYLLAHSYFFYERIANEKASARYFYAVVLANYYQNMSLFSMGTYLVTTYLILNLMNGFLVNLLERQMKDSEAWVRQFKK